MIVDELVELSACRARERTVSDVRIGLGYTAVALDDGACGLAFTFSGEAGGHCAVVDRAGTLRGRPAAEVAAWAHEYDAVTAGVGMACLNALLEPSDAAVEADVREMIEVREGDVVGMVGHFRPLLPLLRDRAGAIHIFERERGHGTGDVQPDWAAPLLLPECDIAILTATALVNRTLDGLLDAASGARECIVVGPTTPLVTEPFRTRGVTLLTGVHVVDADRVLQVIAEGGGTPQFHGCIRKLCVNLRGPGH